MMLKDLRLAQQAAGMTAAPTPLGAAAANLYQLPSTTAPALSIFQGFIA